jgi:predicted metal-binding protein
MKPVQVYCKEILEIGVDGAKGIAPRSVDTAEWVQMKCQYGCPGFGKSLCCPPHTPTPGVTRKVIDSYQKAILLHQKLLKGEKAKSFNEAIVSVEVKIFLDGYYKAWAWAWALAVFVKSVTQPLLVNVVWKRGPLWKPVASMSSRPPGTTDFLLKS